MSTCCPAKVGRVAGAKALASVFPVGNPMRDPNVLENTSVKADVWELKMNFPAQARYVTVRGAAAVVRAVAKS